MRRIEDLVDLLQTSAEGIDVAMRRVDPSELKEVEDESQDSILLRSRVRKFVRWDPLWFSTLCPTGLMIIQ